MKTATKLRLGAPLAESDLSDVERNLHLNYNKWDTQVGDKSVLSEQALVMDWQEWEYLCGCAERLAGEITALEARLVAEEDSGELLGIPRSVWRILTANAEATHRPANATRAMRFDFHPTAFGWRISEVNSDVPGGWREASTLPLLYQPFYDEYEVPASPLDAWGRSMQVHVEKGLVALLSAPRFLEDQQVLLTFMRELQRRNFACELAQSPFALDWSYDGRCKIRSTGQNVSAVVRFYQTEWLCKLPGRTGWAKLFREPAIPITNPAISAISESKRFPLAFRGVSGLNTWSTLFPECRDPRDVSDWEDWVLKATYSNTGDQVFLCGELTRQQQKTLTRRAQRSPKKWMAQRRFQTLPLESKTGVVYPCVGVFVVDGRAAGAYVRLSHVQVTDGAAREAPLLIDRRDFRR